MSTIWTLVISAGAGFAVSVGTNALQARWARREKRQDRLQAILETYREPLANAAFDLQSRLYNICVMRFMETYFSSDEQYAVRSTQWLVSQYLGWNEIVRQRIQFLKVDDAKQDLQLVDLLHEIGSAFASDASGLPRPLRTWRSDQRAIGELMIADSATERWTCIGYAEFLRRVDAGGILAAKVDALGVADLLDPSQRHRAVHLQRALVDLIERMDDDRSRFLLDLRGKVPLDRPLTPAAAIEELGANTDRPSVARFRFAGSPQDPVDGWAKALGWRVVGHEDDFVSCRLDATWRRSGGIVTVDEEDGKVEIRATATRAALWPIVGRRPRRHHEAHPEPDSSCVTCDVNVLLAMFDRPVVRELPRGRKT
jgi:hypothetical protein